MPAVELGHWPLLVAVALMLIAAASQLVHNRVPNPLTLSAIVAGWIVAGLVTARIGIPSSGGGIEASLAATVVALAVSIPFYATGWLGAGCVKAQMAFSAWIGCAVGLPSAAASAAICCLLANLATCAAAGCFFALKPAVDDRELFPAQVTHTVGSVAGLAICAVNALI